LSVSPSLSPQRSPQRDLEGKVALVVGGSRNQGAAIAENIAARGATTVITYAGSETAAQETLAALGKHGGTVEAVRSDARISVEVNELFAGVVERHGRLDVVVHTPGAVLKKPFAECTDEDFDHVFDLNTRSAFNTLRAASRHLADDGRYVVLSTTLTAFSVRWRCSRAKVTSRASSSASRRTTRR